MYGLLAKKGQLFAIALGLVVIIIFLGSAIGGISSAGYSLSDDLNRIMKDNPDQNFSFFNPGLGITLGLIVVAFISAALFGLYQLISAPKNSMKVIITLVVMCLLFFGLYSMADSGMDSAIGNTLQRFNITENTSKLISGGLMTTTILAVLAIVSMIAFEVYNIFK